MNFDNRQPGAFVYSNKQTGAEFEVIPQNQIESVVPINNVFIDSDDSAVDFYDLDGRRQSSLINNKGIYIRKSDKEAHKVVVKTH